MKKVLTILLAIGVMLSPMNASEIAQAATKDITVTPFSGQWKYFGQTKTFIEDEHYSLSSDTTIPDNEWTLDIASEEVGNQAYVLNGTTSNETESLKLAEKAPTFEVKNYTTTAKVAEETEIQTTTGAAVIAAPEGYLISGPKQENEWTWDDELNTGELQEGKNVITYYLRSNKSDATRKAIDQTAKTTVIRVDSIAPALTALQGNMDSDTTADGSITGNEAGMYYYMVIPASSSMEVTPELIKENVASNYGIVGYGRVDGVHAADLNIKGLSPETKYVIYAYMADEAGNISPLLKSDEFATDKMALTGDVTVEGTPAVNNTLTAKSTISSVDTGDLTYQWYRIKLAEDASSLDAVQDESGGAEADDLEADDSDDEEEGDDDDSEEDDDEIEIDAIRKMDVDDELTTVDGATMIADATAATYKITNADIGYRLIARVKAANYSGYIAGSTTSFVPKLIPTYVKPSIASAVYSPTRKLSAIKLSANWTWVDNTIVPVYGNSGYRAKFVPENTAMYKTLIVRVPVPVTKKKFKSSMATVAKTHSYTGKAIKNNFYVEDTDELTLNKDFKVTYKNNKNIGKATITFRGKGNYTGTFSKTYTIKKKSVKSVTYSYKKNKLYSGHAKTASLVVKNGSVRMKKDKDYTVVYKNNIQMGKASIQIKGIGNYTGTKTLHFSIIPVKPVIKSVKRTSKAFKFSISDKNEISGYRIYVSTSSSFKKSKTQEYVTSGTSFGMKGLVKGTKYYVRAKAYKSVKGTSYMSSYSAKKTIKIK